MNKVLPFPLPKREIPQGGINLTANAKHYSAPIGPNDKFSHELTQSVKRGQNPALALEFLARLAVTHLNPHHYQFLSEDERAQWHIYFGTGEPLANPLVHEVIKL